MTKNKLFITGITGTVGRAVLDSVSEKTEAGTMRIKQDWHIFGIASGESKIKELEKLYRHPETTAPSDRLTLDATDINDQMTIDRHVSNADAVIHTAAKKHIDYVQKAPVGAFHTNTCGTLIIAEACRRHNKKLVFMSTDKAVEPILFYGWTKQIAEQIVLGLDCQTPKLSGTVIRSGNIAASSGSIFTIWHREATKLGFISTFNENHTRYVVQRHDLAKLLMEAAKSNWQSKIVMPRRMQLWHMDKLANAVAEYLRESFPKEYKDLAVKAIKRGPVKEVREKKNELMYTESESYEGKVFLWDEETGLQPAPYPPPWDESIPSQDIIERLWKLASEESKRI